MIKVVKDFYISGDDDVIFSLLRKFLPEYLGSHPEDEYAIVEEIIDRHLLYRKSMMKRTSFLNELPRMIQKTLPVDFLNSLSHLTEETVFDEKNKKINFSILSSDIYHIKGSTLFIPISKDRCKVVTMLYFTLLNAEKHFPNKTLSSVVMPFLNNKIPERFIQNQNLYYNEIMKKYKSKP